MRERLRRILRRGPGSGDSAASGDGFHLSEPLDDVAIRRLYDEQVLTQEFYGDSYVASLTAFVSEAAQQLAEAIVATLAPRRVLDVGCGLGQLVLALRRLGVDAVGCDYSEAFIQVAPEEVRPHLQQADVTDLSRYETGRFDLVICMEVLEHLPVDLVHRCVSEMRRVASGTIVVTTPSFGPNLPGRSGLPLDTPTWRADARAGVRFSQIVIAPDGRPHHGHLTLASYAWWTELFRSHALGRNRDVENAWLEDPARPLWHHRWNLYVLHEQSSPLFVPGGNCVRQGDHGWHHVESWPDGAIRWTTGCAALHLMAPCDGPALRGRVWGGPPELVYPRELEVTVTAGPARGRARARIAVEPGEWAEVVLGPVPAAAGEMVDVTLTVPQTFRPELLPDAPPDHRTLGVAVSRIGLEEAPRKGLTMRPLVPDPS